MASAAVDRHRPAQRMQALLEAGQPKGIGFPGTAGGNPATVVGYRLAQPKGNAVAAINYRCIDGLHLDTVPVQHFDGRSG